MYEDNERSIVQRFRAMWTEMGDYLSRQYAGTDSTISRVTRDGKEGFIGKLDHKTKVVRRFMLNTLTDNPMQTSIDIIRGIHLNTGYSSEQRMWLDQQLKTMQDEFSSIDHIKVQVCTWNMGGVKPFESVDLSDWLFPGGASENNPDVFIIGF